MSEIVLEGGVPLRGSVGVLGAKNAVLQQMISTLICPGWHRLSNVPDIADVRALMEVMEHLGVRCDLSDKELAMVVPERMSVEAPLELVRSMRASILLLGPLLTRFGEAKVPLPGGDDLGARPVDMHLNGLRQMGAELELVHGVLVGRAPRGLEGTEVELPFPSVGATQNLMMAAVMARGD
ncbi:MAG: UDP-N-acetylglucosamine 1-carboxyvinyltransferase, partial [bacterium]|nr:UDP-N-acetylglucosamine 1-carboxyvinyltransferase [bacterium]